MNRKTSSRRRGISLMEVAVASLLTGFVLVAAVKAAGQTVLARRKTADRTTAHLLADSLLTEIRALPYCEPGTNEPSIGRDTGEPSGIRSGFDDVDDFHLYADAPPKARDGSLLANSSAWSRSVSVAWVSSTNFSSSGFKSGAKRITITVRLNGTTVHTATAIRTDELWIYSGGGGGDD